MQVRQSTASFIGVLLAVVTSGATAQPRWTDGTLTDEAGLPLYTSQREAPNQSQCTGACLNIWHPYKASDGAKASGDFALFRRDDASLQWTFKGKLLYRWWNASKPLEGVGMAGGNWQVVKQP